MNRTNGRIAEKSKQKIVEALLRIMQTYDYKEITITQITQEAQLSRKTFYRLFSDKEEVLNLFFRGLSAECIASMKNEKASDTGLTDSMSSVDAPTIKEIPRYWDIVQLYFDFCLEHKDILNLLRKNNLLQRLFDISYQQSITVFEYVRTKEVSKEYETTLPYLLAYSIGGMNSLLLRWIEGGMTVPSAEIIAILKVGFMSPEL